MPDELTIENVLTILGVMSQAPDSQIDTKITTRLKEIVASGTVNADDLIDILDDCAAFALASGFAISALDKMWTLLGGTQEQAEARRKVRGGPFTD